MWTRSLFLLLLSMTAIAQTQYGTAPKSSMPSHAQKGCPWLTEGSAAHALDGEVSVTIKISDTGEGFCTFSRQQGPADSLDILVSKDTLPTCPPDSVTLKGIGNEALTCRPRSTHGEAVEMISSRVRDLHFTVTLTTRSQKGSAKPVDPQNDTLEQIAEQIAGNLY